jgi:hypothetical protein
VKRERGEGDTDHVGEITQLKVNFEHPKYTETYFCSLLALSSLVFGGTLSIQNEFYELALACKIADTEKE